jgi:membrane dipeptidase
LIPIFDGHNDTLKKIYLKKQEGIDDFFTGRNKTNLDLDMFSAEKGGLKGGIFSINVPDPEGKDPMSNLKWTKNGYITPLANPIDYGYAKEFTDEVLSFSFDLVQRANNRIKIVKDFIELKNSFNNRILTLVLHFEGGEAIDKDLGNLEDYYNKGLRVLAPVWSRQNNFGRGVPFSFGISPDIGSGLTKEGENLIKKCNRVGITVDVSHMNEKGFWDSINVSSKPLVASHSNAYSLSKSTRNLTDEQIKAIGDCNGVIGVNFSAGFIRSDGLPKKTTPIKQLINHIDYIVNLIGIDNVAIGSDFDGALIIKDLSNASKLQRLRESLKMNGYSKEDIIKICHKNWFRVIKTTWKS